MPIYNTYAIHYEEKVISVLAVSYQKPSAVSINFVDKDFDDPFENPVEKGLAFTGMDLCFAFGFSRTLASLPIGAF